MQHTLAIAVLAALLSGCVSATAQKNPRPWLECAREEAVALLQHGVSESWPVASALPDGLNVEVVSLEAHPPEAIADAVYRTLHLARSTNAFYLEQTGGFAGMRQLYGPVSLSGRCTRAP